MICPHAPIALDPGYPAEVLARLPVLVQHGIQDPMIPVERARESRDLSGCGGRDAGVLRNTTWGMPWPPASARDLSGWVERVLAPGSFE